jgi:predicted DNA-binding antitoxin AbrB/MazE fold protein
MTRVLKAVYSRGVFRPLEAVELAENQPVELTVKTVAAASNGDRDAARQRLLESLRSSPLRLTRPLPTRDELHKR